MNTEAKALHDFLTSRNYKVDGAGELGDKDWTTYKKRTAEGVVHIAIEHPGGEQIKVHPVTGTTTPQEASKLLQEGLLRRNKQ